MAEYALRDVHKPIGISDYELGRALPKDIKSSLPFIEELENKLSQPVGGINSFLSGYDAPQITQIYTD